MRQTVSIYDFDESDDIEPTMAGFDLSAVEVDCDDSVPSDKQDTTINS